jgi:hypothetical protein
MVDRIFDDMKVTALIPDEIVKEVKELTHGKNITESLVLALTEWIRIQKLKNIKEKIKSAPLSFQTGFSADSVRSVNRKTS